MFISSCLIPLSCRLVLFNPINDDKLWKFQQNSQKIAHPSESIRLASGSDFGILAGNSNHCDFFVGEIRWTTQLSAEQIEEFYEDMFIPAVQPYTLWDEPGSVEHISVLIVRDGLMTEYDRFWLPYSLNTFDAWGGNTSEYQDGILYFVYVFIVGYDPGSDVRCH